MWNKPTPAQVYSEVRPRQKRRSPMLWSKVSTSRHQQCMQPVLISATSLAWGSLKRATLAKGLRCCIKTHRAYLRIDKIVGICEGTELEGKSSSSHASQVWRPLETALKLIDINVLKAIIIKEQSLRVNHLRHMHLRSGDLETALKLIDINVLKAIIINHLDSQRVTWTMSHLDYSAPARKTCRVSLKYRCGQSQRVVQRASFSFPSRHKQRNEVCLSKRINISNVGPVIV